MRRWLLPFALLAGFLAGPAGSVPSFWNTYQSLSSTPTVIFITATNNSWPIPADWNSSVVGSNPYANKVECVGSGQGGTEGTSPPGGTGATYAAQTNISLVPGSSLPVNVSAGGAQNGGVGQDAFFNGGTCVASSVCAPGGGSASSAVGSTTHAGGSGAVGGGARNGGGGAGGPNGVGAGNSTSSGGTADNGSGGAGGTLCAAGGNGTEWDASHGSGGGGAGGTGGGCAGVGGSGGAYGGGGGSGSAGNSGTGGAGICVVTYYALR